MHMIIHKPTLHLCDPPSACLNHSSFATDQGSCRPTPLTEDWAPLASFSTHFTAKSPPGVVSLTGWEAEFETEVGKPNVYHGALLCSTGGQGKKLDWAEGAGKVQWGLHGRFSQLHRELKSWEPCTAVGVRGPGSAHSTPAVEGGPL